MDSQDIPLQMPLLFSGDTVRQIKSRGESAPTLKVGRIRSADILIEPYGEVSFSKLIDVYREKAEEMKTVCDVFILEEMSALWDIRAAVLGCKKADRPIYVLLKTDKNGETADGTVLLHALIVLQELGIAGFGASGQSPEVCGELLSQILPYSHIPLIASANTCDDKALPQENELAEKIRDLISRGASAVDLGKNAAKAQSDAVFKILSDLSNTQIPNEESEKQDTSLVFATYDQIFFLDPETTEFSPPVECSPDMDSIITDMCDESYDVLTVAVNSPDDAIDFSKQMHMATLPVAFLSDDEISLKMALMLYQGRAIVDAKSLIDPLILKKIAGKYGAVLY